MLLLTYAHYCPLKLATWDLILEQLTTIQSPNLGRKYLRKVLSLKNWNSLEEQSRNAQFFADSNVHYPNFLYCLGDRLANIKHAQLRMQCSNLNSHLFNLHVVDSPTCPCGHDVEDNNHFFLTCGLYHIIRNNPKTRLLAIPNMQDKIHIDILLFGSDNLPLETNKEIFLAVHEFITESRRLWFKVLVLGFMLFFTLLHIKWCYPL